MLLGRKKDEAPKQQLASGYTGRTQKLLREGKKQLEAGIAKPPLVMRDAEDRAPCTLNEATWVARAQLEEPMVASRLVEAAAPALAPLPDLSHLRAPAPEAVLAAISKHQEAILQDMLQREAGREALRRVLQGAEKVEWRAAQMGATFAAERTEAHERLKRTMAEFRAAKGGIEARFAKERAAGERVDAARANRDRVLAAEAAAAGDQPE